MIHFFIYWNWRYKAAPKNTYEKGWWNNETFFGKESVVSGKVRAIGNRRWLGRNRGNYKEKRTSCAIDERVHVGMKKEQGAYSTYKKEVFSRMFDKAWNHNVYWHLVPILLNLKRPFPFKMLILIIVSEERRDCVMATIKQARGSIFKWGCVRLKIFFRRVTNNDSSIRIRNQKP